MRMSFISSTATKVYVGTFQPEEKYYFYINTQITQNRRYEIIGHIIENRRRAQGRSVMKGPLFTDNVNIRDELWTRYGDDSADPKPAAGEAPNGIDPTNKRFCVHRWHSGEFQGPGSPGIVGETKAYLSRSPVPGYSTSVWLR